MEERDVLVDEERFERFEVQNLAAGRNDETSTRCESDPDLLDGRIERDR
jgi:hypothetical protein